MSFMTLKNVWDKALAKKFFNLKPRFCILFFAFFLLFSKRCYNLYGLQAGAPDIINGTGLQESNTHSKTSLMEQHISTYDAKKKGGLILVQKKKNTDMVVQLKVCFYQKPDQKDGVRHI